MARKVKIPNHIKKRFERTNKKRQTNVLNKRKYYLIVCEGEKTEPNYFRSIRSSLPKGVLETCEIKIEGTGFNTLSLIRKSIQLQTQIEKETSRKIDKLWVVFDRDSFSAQDFNSAVTFCNGHSPVIGCAWTNEAFELWYLLHFHFYNTAISRSRYQKLIEGNLSSHLGREYKYRKNAPEMYNLLLKYGSMQDAIRNAIALEANFAGRHDFANHNPCTKVHELVAELFNLEALLQVEE